MLENDFIAPSINVDTLDSKCECAKVQIVTELQEAAGLNRIMSNSFGFGGTNASLVFEKYQG